MTLSLTYNYHSTAHAHLLCIKFYYVFSENLVFFDKSLSNKFLIFKIDKFLVLQTLLIVAMAEKVNLDLVNKGQKAEPWFGLENRPNEYLYLLFSLLFILWDHNSENQPVFCSLHKISKA